MTNQEKIAPGEPDRLREALSRAFVNVRLDSYEAEIIGEMLVAFFETEQFLDECISVWLSPIIYERIEALRDLILIYTPLARKLEMAKQLKILDKNTVDQFYELSKKRNSLAHRRTEQTRIAKTISKQQKAQFVEQCRQIQKSVLMQAKFRGEEVVAKLRKDYSEIVIEVLKGVVPQK